MNLSGMLGLLVAVSVIAGAMLLGSADAWDIALFVNIPSIIFVLGLGCGLELMASSVPDLKRALWGLRVLAVEAAPDGVSRRDASILRDLSLRLYVAGVVGVLIGVVQLLTNLDDPAQLGRGLAVAILPLLTAFLLAEVVLRPAAQRITFLGADQAEGSSVGL